MKKTFKARIVPMLGTQSRRLFSPLCAIALAAIIIGFGFTACDNGSDDDNGGNGTPQTATYASYDASGNSYTLVVITLNGSTMS